MNYLAHSYLSNNDPGLLVGNFIADHLHGNQFDNFPPRIVEGVKLHRNIDVFTDSHPLFKESKRFFYQGFEKYSGILVDIYFDHLLAKNYGVFSKEPLDEYCRKVYDVYIRHAEILPQSSRDFLNYVRQNNVYYAYSTEQGIEQVLNHLSHRIGHGVMLQHSLGLFKENEKAIEENFLNFFKEAIGSFLKP